MINNDVDVSTFLYPGSERERGNREREESDFAVLMMVVQSNKVP